MNFTLVKLNYGTEITFSVQLSYANEKFDRNPKNNFQTKLFEKKTIRKTQFQVQCIQIKNKPECEVSLLRIVNGMKMCAFNEYIRWT